MDFISRDDQHNSQRRRLRGEFMRQSDMPERFPQRAISFTISARRGRSQVDNAASRIKNGSDYPLDRKVLKGEAAEKKEFPFSGSDIYTTLIVDFIARPTAKAPPPPKRLSTPVFSYFSTLVGCV